MVIDVPSGPNEGPFPGAIIPSAVKSIDIPESFEEEVGQ
jgi:hypothetical protein